MSQPRALTSLSKLGWYNLKREALNRPEEDPVHEKGVSMGTAGVVITVMSGADDGKVFRLDKVTFMLGRHPDDDVCLPHDRRVSRHHARMTPEGNSYVIEDVGPSGRASANGTYVNDTTNRITGKVIVSSGDMILLGSVWVRFETR